MRRDGQARPAGKIALEGPDKGRAIVVAALPDLVGWIAIGYFEPVDGSLSLARLEITTEQEGHRRGPPFQKLIKNPEPAARGELGSAQLRSVPLEQMQQTAIGLTKHFLPKVSVQSDRSRPGRRGRGDLYYATWAAAYVEAVHVVANSNASEQQSRPKPVEVLANRENLSPSQVRNILHEARRRELLTQAPPGKAGGSLTPRCRSLLKSDQPRTGVDDGPHPEA